MALARFDFRPPRFTLRGFGLFWLPAACFTLSGWLWRHQKDERAIALLVGLAVVSILLGWFAPHLLRLPYVVISLISFPIALVVSLAFLSVLFFFLVTPLGWVRRRLDRGALRLNLRRNVQSYWTKKAPAPARARYLRPY